MKENIKIWINFGGKKLERDRDKIKESYSNFPSQKLENNGPEKWNRTTTAQVSHLTLSL
jgi:hypothetical protein